MQRHGHTERRPTSSTAKEIHGVGIVQNHPFNDYGWGARAEELVPTATPWQLVVWVICADAS